MSLNQQLDAHRVHSGWLYKKGFYNTSWKKRFFVLYDDRTIHYFSQESHASNRGKAKGKIHLTQIPRVELVTYSDPRDKHKSNHTSSKSSHHKLYRTNSLPMDPIHSHSNLTSSSSNHHRSSSIHYRSIQSHDGNVPLSPTIHTIGDSSSFKQTHKHTQSPQKSSKHTYDSHSIHLQPRRIDRTSTAAQISSSSLSTSTRYPLQSISELESIDPVPPPSLTPYSITSGYTASQRTGIDIISPVHKLHRHVSPVHGVNGWSFSNTDADNYFSSPSNIISSSQPPPDYDEIIQNENNNKYLDASLLALKHSYDRNTTHNLSQNNMMDAATETAPINRRHSASSAQINLTLNLPKDTIQIKHKRRGRSASHSSLHSSHNSPLTLQSSCTTTIQSVPNVVQDTKHRKASKSSVISYSFGDQSTSQSNSTDTVECELSDNELNMDLSRSRYNEDPDIILSAGIRSHKSSYSTECSQFDHDCAINESKKDEYDIFQAVIGDSHLGLKCDRRYSFALIHPNREYILSAQTNEALKDWISIFNRLTQGEPLFSGYLALKDKRKDKIWSKKFFLLFENKVLNYYKDHNDVNNGKSCEFDIDLRHVMWLRYCAKNEFGDKIKLKQYFSSSKENSSTSSHSYYLSTPSGNSVINPLKSYRRKRHSVYSLEIAIPNRLFILTADSLQTRNEWYAQIRNVFADTLILKRYYDSSVLNIYMVHSDSNYRNRYIAFFGGIGLVIFQDKKVLKDIKRMTFFDETVFKDYIRKKHCTIIPINQDVNVRRATSNQHGKCAFVVSNHYDQRKWYFDCSKKRILDKWIYLLVDKRWMNTQKPRLLKKNKKKKNSNYKLQITQHTKMESKKKKKKRMKTHSCDFVIGPKQSISDIFDNFDPNDMLLSKESPMKSAAPVSPHNNAYAARRCVKKKLYHSDTLNDLSNSLSHSAHSDYFIHDIKQNFVYQKKVKRSTSIDAHDADAIRPINKKSKSKSKRSRQRAHINLDAMFLRQF